MKTPRKIPTLREIKNNPTKYRVHYRKQSNWNEHGMEYLKGKLASELPWCGWDKILNTGTYRGRDIWLMEGGHFELVPKIQIEVKR